MVIKMNRRMVLNTIGKIILAEAALMVLPVIVCLVYRNESIKGFLIAILIAVVSGLLLTVLSKPSTKVIYSKEGFVIVALAWIAASVVGALPFVFSGEIPSFTDAFFETVSGFTTTGSSILTDVESMSEGPLFWRSFTHWIGGMGILVFVLALSEGLPDRSIHILRAEMPGPIIDKLVPKARSTAKILYLIYIGMTVVEIVCLCLAGMPFFESLLHSIGTAGTGGFGIKADSLAGYSSLQQWIVAVFMFLFGVNFNLYYAIIFGKITSALKSSELWVYVGSAVASCTIIAINIYNIYGNVSDSLRHSAFQVATVMTTTGYSSDDFNLWPTFSKTVLLILMFVGGCAGSTAGGFKVSRAIILVKAMGRELKKLLHPRTVKTLRFERKKLDEKTVSGTLTYLGFYCACMLTVLFLLGLDVYDLETNFSAAISCFNNIGPGLGAVGPMANFDGYSDLSKIVLSAAMLLGRLEIIPLFICFSPATWSRKS